MNLCVPPAHNIAAISSTIVSNLCLWQTALASSAVL
jgi:hypothetical protein